MRYIQYIHHDRQRRQDYIHPPENGPILNILIRTGNRPTLFRSCMDSVARQEYPRIRVHVSYDTPESLAYLDGFPDISLVPVSPLRDVSYFYNLYCNDLLSCVEGDWIMFLDDDECFCDSRAVSAIIQAIMTENDTSCIFVWKFLRADALIFPKNEKDIQFGEIDTCSFCFHHSLWCQSGRPEWSARAGGDYHFFKQLLHSHSHLRLVDRLLTTTIQKDRIGNHGRLVEISI